VKAIDRCLIATGLLIPVWLFSGVALTAMGYPGYSHLDQAMSQLGAIDAPTHGYSAWVNNYPLGALFALFALGVVRRFPGSRLAILSGVLILVHGLGSFATGYFSCDQGCASTEPSTSQQIHNLAGLVMFCSLTVASAIWVFLGKRLMPSSRFGTISMACLVFAVVTVSMMAKAFADGHLFGLYQRLNYGVSVVWIAALSAMALRRKESLGWRQAASS
jgi:hypothetical membrane protein